MGFVPIHLFPEKRDGVEVQKTLIFGSKLKFLIYKEKVYLDRV